MAIEIKLFGFGEERPPRFGGCDILNLDLDTPATPWTVLRAAGIDDATGLVLMNLDRVLPHQHWNDRIVDDETRLTLLSAIEGG